MVEQVLGELLDTVLGVSVAPTAVRLVLVEGENGDGALVDEDAFDVSGDGDAATIGAAEQVISAILGTREGASEGGYQLTSTGVTWRDPAQAAALRDVLARRKIENVVLVSAFLAAAALAHAVGSETNYAQTALLFIEPEAATLAVVDSADGSVTDIHRLSLSDDDDTAVGQLTELISQAESLPTRPDAVFLVGSGIDLPLIKPTLEASTTLPVTAAEEPDTALARGAALAAASSPLFASSTAAQAWAQDPGSGVLYSHAPYGLDAAYFDDVSDQLGTGQQALAYSAVPEEQHERRPFALLASIMGSIFIIGVGALAVSLAVSIRSEPGTRPDPGQSVVTHLPAPAHAARPSTPGPGTAGSGAPSPSPGAPGPGSGPSPGAPSPARGRRRRKPRPPGAGSGSEGPGAGAGTGCPSASARAAGSRASSGSDSSGSRTRAGGSGAGSGAHSGAHSDPASPDLWSRWRRRVPGGDDDRGGRGGGRGGGHGGGHGRGGFNIPFIPGI
ncbi:hypothetical protein MMRN_05900 [Mycobacterium marinum]|nr:hypothetical protein MMRN_05900 [Mycobacterium marinum]